MLAAFRDGLLRLHDQHRTLAVVHSKCPDPASPTELLTGEALGAVGPLPEELDSVQSPA